MPRLIPGLGLMLLAFHAGTATGEEIPEPCRSMVAAIGAPEVLRRDDRVVLCRLGYVLSHDGERKTPNWVVEHLVPEHLKGSASRKDLGDPFKPDPEVESGKRAELDDYKAALPDGRRFDRGHMAPAASMKFDALAMKQSFYLSNMAPQQGPGLNRTIWAELEEIVRDWVCDRGELYVVTGPIYAKDDPDQLGPDAVAVPTAFFKVAIDVRARRAIAFILPNEKVDKRGRPAWEALKDYIKTLQEVEDQAGVRMLGALDRREQRRLKRLRSVMWPVEEGCRG